MSRDEEISFGANQVKCKHNPKSIRHGSASMDSVLILGVILPLILFLFTVVPRMIQLVYEMTVVIVGSPMMQIFSHLFYGAY